MKSRIVFLFFIMTMVFGILITRAFYLQLLPQERLTELQKRQYKTNVTLRSRRGSIFDRNGQELAVSIASYSLYADPKIIKHPYALSKKVARILKTSRSKIMKKFKNKKKRFVWVKRQVSQKLKDQLLKLKERGLGFIEEPKRVYPNNHVLSQVVGFTGREGDGLEGLEKSMNTYIAGQKKRVSLQRDARGRPLLMDLDIFEPPKDGSDVHLTIDSELQYMLERELSNSVRQYRADSAVGVLLDAQTSEVLALANVPTYDLNSPFQYAPSYRRNRAVSDIFEPGSTMKPFVIAAALAEKVVKVNTKINCEDGRLKIGRQVIGEADAKHNFKFLTVSEVLAHSSNIGTSKIAFKLGAKKFRKYLSRFGFDKKVGTVFPGESKGLLKPLGWNKHLLANISFGHGIATTPLHIAQAYAVIANGGVLKTPSMIKSINGVEPGSWEKERDIDRRVLDPKVAQTMRYLLTASTSRGSTGFKARVSGFQVAGKTGTAQKVDFKKGGYLKNAYISSFSGFVPAHKPRYVIYIAVDNPQGKYYGSQVAAPIFSKVAGYALRRAGVEPILLSKKNLLESMNPFARGKIKSSKIKRQLKKDLQGKDYMPDIKGLSLREVLKVFNKKDISVSVKGVGLVIDFEPRLGELLTEKSKVKLILESYK